MVVPSWPAELPQRVLTDGYSEKQRDGRLFSRTSSGPGKVRRRYSSAVLQVTAAMIVTYAQKARFERFWDDETAGGSLPFIMPDQTHDGLALLDGGGLPILDGGGLPILITANWLVRFGQEAPQVTPWGLQFQTSFQLDVLP